MPLGGKWNWGRGRQNEEILFNEAHEQGVIGAGHLCAHGNSLDLEAMLGVKREVIVGEDELISCIRN